MNNKKLISYFFVYLSIMIVMICGISILDRADDDKQFAKNAMAESSTVDNKKIENETHQVVQEEETTTVVEKETVVEESETINVDDVVVHMGEGKADRTNVGARIYTDVDPDKPMVALTFDDGPDTDSTNAILDALVEYDARATFFVVGYKVAECEATVKRAYDIGCEIGSHTYSHVDITRLNKSQRRAQINNNNKIIRAITGQDRILIRPPYGAISASILKEIDVPIILWSIDTEDWITRDSESTVKNVMDNVKDGSIILMHDSYDETAEATVEIIKRLKKEGYQLVTVSELGYHKFGGLAKGVKYGAMYGDE